LSLFLLPIYSILQKFFKFLNTLNLALAPVSTSFLLFE
jgi:hypothetical protein